MIISTSVTERWNIFRGGGGGKVIFPDFFPEVKCFFPVENSHFGRPKTNFQISVVLKSEKQKGGKKKVLLSFCNFPPPSIVNFPPFLFQFSSFSSPFSLFSCPSFPGRSAESQDFTCMPPILEKKNIWKQTIPTHFYSCFKLPVY